MNIRVQKTLTAMVLIGTILFAGSCRRIPEHAVDAPMYQGPTTDTAASDFYEAPEESSSELQNSSQVSSDKTSSNDMSGLGNQEIIDTGKDVGAMDDPEDPQAPADEDNTRPDDTIIIPPVSSKSPVSSGAGSSSSKPPASSAQTTTSLPSSAPSASSKPPVSSAPSVISSAISSLLSSLLPPSASSKPPFLPPKNGWYDYEGNRYLYQDGKPVGGYQSSNGIGYYFEKDGRLASKVGIDVSKFQYTGTVNKQKPINWNKVKQAGVDYAIIRVGYRGYGAAGTLARDPRFLENITNATAVGIDCGIYFFTQAKTEAEAREEARTAVKWLEESGKKITYPIYFDTEKSTSPTGTGRADKLTKAQRTATAKAFCEEIKRLGYYPGIYASSSWLDYDLDMSKLKEYDVWVAHYRSDITKGPSYKGAYQMWQYTGSGTVGGIDTKVDRNIGLFDYPTYFKQNGWNKLK